MLASGACLFAIASAPLIIDLRDASPPSRFVVDGNVAALSSKGQDPAGSIRTHILDAAGQPTVHSATLANLPEGGVGAWWYGGGREGGKDVAVWSSRFDPEADRWTPAETVMTRELLASQQGRCIEKLGGNLSA